MATVYAFEHLCNDSIDTLISHWWKKYTYLPQQKKNKPHIITSSFRFYQACKSRPKFMIQYCPVTDPDRQLISVGLCRHLYKSISDNWVK